MLNGLDLFTGIGGLTIALSEWVRPVAYCENDRYAQGVLLSRMADKSLPLAPIWDDVKTLTGEQFHCGIDIIYGGFPCQDISVAGHGEGLAGERSGLFFEIIRLAKQIKPTFIFLENVPAIRLRGLKVVGEELADAGYDCRWCVVSAEEMGAPHLRKRWFLLAHSMRPRLEGQREKSSRTEEEFEDIMHNSWWETEPSMDRVANGVSNRVDKIKCLGNSVVPMQARKAFKELMGIRQDD